MCGKIQDIPNIKTFISLILIVRRKFQKKRIIEAFFVKIQYPVFYPNFRVLNLKMMDTKQIFKNIFCLLI